MKRLIIILFAAVLACCTHTESEPLPAQEGSGVSLTFVPDRAVTKSTGEDAIVDVNVYLFSRLTGLAYHAFATSSEVRIACLPGDYDLYAVVNVYRDMGEMSLSGLLSYLLVYKYNYETIPMSGQAVVGVHSEGSDATVKVRRNLAKIVCNVSVGEQAPLLEILSIEMQDLASINTFFAENQAPATLCSSGPRKCAPSENRSLTHTYYVLENCRGDVPGITSPQERNMQNAPQGASYLRIHAQREGKMLAYDVYLGQNTTTNFDVRRNTALTLDIRILGENEVDARIHAFEVVITDDMPDPDFSNVSTGDEYCIADSGKRLCIVVDNPSLAGPLTVVVRLKTGQTSAFVFDGRTAAEHERVLDNPSGVYAFTIAYIPDCYTASNSELVYEVTVKNADGFVYRKTFTHRFYNRLVVYTD